MHWHGSILYVASSLHLVEPMHGTHHRPMHSLTICLCCCLWAGLPTAKLLAHMVKQAGAAQTDELKDAAAKFAESLGPQLDEAIEVSSCIR